MNRKELGSLGENLAQSFLKKKGYHILETNVRCPEGEIDIVAERKKTLSFVEVRTKSSPEFGTPEESITISKRDRMVACALTYLARHKQTDVSWRIDFVAVELTAEGKASRIELIENVTG